MHLKSKINKINIYCWILYCIYAIFTLTILGYGVYFLSNFGYSYVEIGLTIGIGALISSIIQPFIGRLADIRQYSWKSILTILTLVLTASSLLIFVAPKFALIYLFGLMVVSFGCMYPFLNTAVFYYEDYGIQTNFGVSRGFSSLSYMIFAAVLGYILVGNNVLVINVLTIISAIIMLFILYSLPYYGNSSNKEKKSNFKGNIIFKYPRFMCIFIAVALFMIFHQIFMCYMINIFDHVGGNITDVSICNSLGALFELPIMFLFALFLKRISAYKLILIAAVFYVARSLMIFSAHDTLGIYLSLILHMFSFAIIIPASVYWTDEIMDEEDKYEGQAFIGSTLTIGLIFANLFSGQMLQAFDVSILLVALVIITVLGAVFAFSSLLFKR